MAAKPGVTRRPTARGWGLVLCGLLLFLLGTHLSANAILLVAFFLIALPISAMLTVWAVPGRLTLGLDQLRAVPVGETVTMTAQVIPSQPHKVALSLRSGLGQFWAAEGPWKRLPAGLPRGVHVPGAIELRATDPLGLFRASRFLTEDESAGLGRLTVYPRPDWNNSARPSTTGTARAWITQTGEHAGIRAYRPGDARRSVDWRATARADALMVREYEEAAQDRTSVFDWDDMAGQDVEDALSRLTAGILDAAQQGASVGLILPDQSFGPAKGSAHVDAMLQSLASFSTPTALGEQR